MYVAMSQVPWYQRSDEEYRTQIDYLVKESNSNEEFLAMTNAQWLAEAK